jgi:hypothetical protein
MKLYVACGVAFCSSVAMADPVMFGDEPPAPPVQAPHGVSLEIGPSIGRVEALQGAVLPTEGAHFATHISISHIFYLGGEVDYSRISGNGPAQIENALPGSPTITTAPQPNLGMDVPLQGNATTVEALVGARAFAGMFSGGLELAVGERDLQIHDVQASIGGAYWTTVYDARVRFDVWATPRISVGAIADEALQDFHDTSIALVVGIHALPYDAAR